MANPSSRGQQRDKPYRDALRMEQLALANGEVIPHPVGSLRAIAQARLISACAADGQADAREIADRLDGKVAQAIIGDKSEDAIQLEQIQRVIVDSPANSDSAGVPPVTGAGEV